MNAVPPTSSVGMEAFPAESDPEPLAVALCMLIVVHVCMYACIYVSMYLCMYASITSSVGIKALTAEPSLSRSP